MNDCVYYSNYRYLITVLVAWCSAEFIGVPYKFMFFLQKSIWRITELEANVRHTGVGNEIGPKLKKRNANAYHDTNYSQEVIRIQFRRTHTRSLLCCSMNENGRQTLSGWLLFGWAERLRDSNATIRSVQPEGRRSLYVSIKSRPKMFANSFSNSASMPE